MSVTALDHRSSRVGTALVIAVALATTAALVLLSGRTDQSVLGVIGALALAGALLALDRGRFEPVAVAIGALVVPFLGTMLVVSVGDTLADQFQGTQPIGSVMIVTGATVAVFGAATTARGVLRRETVVRTLKIGVADALVVGAAVSVLLLARLSATGEAGGVTGGTVVSILLDPRPGRIHLAVFIGLVLLAGYGLRAAVRTLPAAQLLGHRVEPGRREQLREADYVARYMALPLAGLFGLLLVFERLPSPYRDLPGPIADLLAWVTGTVLLRWPLVLVGVVSIALAAAGWLVQRAYRVAERDALVGVTPYAVGGGLVLVATAFEGQIVRALRRELAIRVPPEARPGFRELSGNVIEFYGADVLALAAVLLVVVVALMALALLLGVLLTDSVPETATGPAVASAGVFVVAAFTVTITGQLLPGLIGVVASVLVWDTGEFGAGIGRELGTGATSARTELVHVGGTLLVGLGAVGVALSLSGIAGRLDAGAVPVVPALLLALLGVLLLVVASR